MASPKNWSKKQVSEVDKPNVVMQWESDVWRAHVDVAEITPKDVNPLNDPPTDRADYQVKAYVTRPPGYQEDFTISRRETSKKAARKAAVRWMRDHSDPTPPEMAE